MEKNQISSPFGGGVGGEEKMRLVSSKGFRAFRPWMGVRAVTALSNSHFISSMHTSCVWFIMRKG